MEGVTQVVLDVVEQMETLDTTSDEVWNRFLSFAKQFGFQFGALCDLPGPQERFEDTMVCLSWPEGWPERYFEQGYVTRDPAVMQSAQSPDPYMWSELLANPVYNAGQRRIVHEATEFGMNNGLVVPILTLRYGMTLVTVGGSQRVLSTRERAELQLAAIYAHARVRELSPRKRRLPTLQALSPRERECLAWAAAGKSDWEIGEILSISERTAYAHIENVRRKYGVASRHQAIVLGLRSGAIYA
jgi:LuxR family quorum sensing-dependent transcriptional regulator